MDRTDQANPETYHGSFSCGTNIVAEMMAYVLPLLKLSASTKKLALRHIHIITDCQYLAEAAEKPNQQRKSNVELWGVFRSLKARGLLLHWHWVPRDTLDMNKFSHDLANAARKATAPLADEIVKQTDWQLVQPTTAQAPE